MILQTDSRLRKEVQTSNGLGMCIYWYLNKILKREISIDAINSFLPTLATLSKDFEVNNKKPYYMCKPNEYEILEIRSNYNQFYVCGDGLSHVTYDPKGTSDEAQAYLSGDAIVINKIVLTKKED